MKFMIEYPVFSDREGSAWVQPDNIAEFARVAEASGVDALAFTDHPAPSKKWLDGGGHETIDQFVALGFCAAITRRMRMMTYLTVLPYRNPLITAKSMTAVDVLSGGRSIFVLGAGYLRSEFSALGVDFDKRQELFDEAADVLKGIWSNDNFQYQGQHFKAIGQIMKPGPVQRPHPPLWIGGNATTTRERVARWAQGWAPLLGGPTLSKTTRTAYIGSDQELARCIRDIGDRMEAHGRDRSKLDVLCGSPEPLPEDASVDQQLDKLRLLANMGVTWTHFRFTQSSFPAALDSLRQYGEQVAAGARSL